VKVCIWILVFLTILSGGCSRETQHDTNAQRETFSSSHNSRMREFISRLNEADVDFDQTFREGVMILGWDADEDAVVRPILCDLFPPPPPAGRALALEPAESMRWFTKTLLQNGIDVVDHEFEDRQFIVWEASDTDRVEDLFRQAFGYDMMPYPDLPGYRRNMKCDGPDN
jgi:hypothetical protein